MSPQVFCVGLVTDFGEVDSGIQHEAWLALQDAKAGGVVDRIDFIETIDARDRAANIEAFASAGYDVIVTVGSSIADETVTAAQEHSNLLFVGIEQPQALNLPNLAGLIFHEERSGFLAGALAAMVTRTRHVAAVCESRFLDPIRRYCEGFQAGVAHVDPAVFVDVVFRTGSTDDLYRDTAWGRAQAIAAVQQGADVLFAAGGDTAQASLEAAAAGGALVIGTESDLFPQLTGLRPKLLTCSVSYVRDGVLDLLRRARSGTLPSGNYFGQAGLSAFHSLDSSVPTASRQRLLQLQRALESGSLQLDIAYDNPSD